MIDEGVFFCIIEIVDLLIVLYVRRRGEKSPLRKQAMLTHSLFTPPPYSDETCGFVWGATATSCLR